jgi:GT2 family glycosyltransferase
MRFSVIIPTYNRKDLLLRCLAAATGLDYPDYEIVVADDGATDGSIAAAQEAFPHVRYVPHAINTGEPAARNRGINAATGEIIAFIDDDCVAPRDWLQRHARHYDDPRIAAVGGPQVCRAPNFFEKFDTVRYGVKFQRLQTIESIAHFEHLITGNMSVRRAVLERVGAFDERFLTGCDSDFIRRLSRAGYWFVRDPALQVDHLKTYRLGSYLRMRFHRGCAAVMTDVKEGTLELRRFVPLLNPVGALEHWRHFQKLFGGGAGVCACFWGFAQLTRCIDVAGRVYYYWTIGRRYRAPAPRV